MLRGHVNALVYPSCFVANMTILTRAAPYSLHPLRCGHTFDALCILRWFFSKAHQACGGWHEYVACPICRSRLVLPPDQLPRHEITFPFIPNRTADAAIKDLVGQLEDSCSSGFKRELGSSSEKGRVKVKKADGNARPAGLDGWRTGGNLRKEWLKRDK